MSLEHFKHSPAGSHIAAIFQSREVLAGMEAKSREGRPAVEAVGALIAAKVGNLADEDRKMVGRWVREVLEPRGWIPERKGRVAPGNLFSRGTIYRRRGGDIQADPQSGLVAARALLARMPHPAMTADELIAMRRRAFEAGE